MDFFTLDRNFKLQDTIDKFKSAIWSERNYGDSDFQLSVPVSKDATSKLRQNTFIYLSGSKEVMIIDTINFENGVMTVSGGNLMQWMNNRVIRATAAHEDRYWTIVQTPGVILAQIIQYHLVAPNYGDGTANPTGIPAAVQQFSTLSVKAFDSTGDTVTIAIPYGPMYDAMKEIAQTYDIGQTITLEAVSDTTYFIQYQNYRGIDRTSSQSANPLVRFSPQLDSLTSIKELQTSKGSKKGCYSYAPGNPGGLADGLPRPGIYWSSFGGGATPRIGFRDPPPYDPTKPVLLRNFDAQLMMEYEEDITTDTISGDSDLLQKMLDERAKKAIVTDHRSLIAVDGTLVPLNQYQYGRDYSLGDIIEVQGNTGAIAQSRVTEYIRAQDDAGERAYPTLDQVA